LQIYTKSENRNIEIYEKKILDLKYKSRPFSKLTSQELKASASRLLAKINVITGWALYEDPKTANILKEQFELKLVESYPLVNVDEMEYAFRSNTAVKDWGKFLNLALIDEVMIPYLTQRRELSDREEASKKPLPLPAPDEPELTDEDFIEANRSVFKLTGSYGLISTKVYDILVAQGKINLTDEEKGIIKAVAVTNFFAADNKENTKNLSHAERDRYIKQDCKKIATANYFNKQ